MNTSEDKLGVTACPWCSGELFGGRHTNPEADCPGPPKPAPSKWKRDKGAVK